LVPEYVARRLPVIAYEDVGVAALPLLVWTKHAAAAIPVLPAPTRRDVAASVASRLARSLKSRTACDIVCLIEASDQSPHHARDLSRRNLTAWIDTAADRALPLLRRAIAVRFVLGIGVLGIRPSGSAAGRPGALALMAAKMQLPAPLVQAVHVGRQTHNLHAALPLAYELLHAGGPPVTARGSKAALRTAEANGLLLCAVDMYTRCGRQAYRRLARANDDLHRLLRTFGGNADPASAIGILLFHREGSLLDRALVSPASEDLLTRLESLEAQRAGLADAAGVRQLTGWLQKNADIVDSVRADTLADYLRPGTSDTDFPKGQNERTD